MRNAIIKSGPTGILTLGHPLALPGWANNQAINYKIRNVPDDVTDSTLLRIANSTVLWRGGSDPQPADCVYEFAELGAGVIVK